ncbi:LysR family transcriptional regulator [Flintibacter sp. NSJ-23]|uniref:LysR family transcriptional regulator n=1 Tax=Flintibacter hominis TaxID=2763048 RepID=A0A8J6MCG2_9FIRM|nr:LysR family transcriptional regulator [Flintibacter hominis]MBC5721791.1 LysR family transcriptional regulator [Flintibacter hominis]
MNVEYYRNFIAIIDEGSMSAAAQKLHIAQPALSNQLKVLEKEFNAVLMERNGRRLHPTEAGLILYDRAKSICDHEDNAQKQIQACTRGTQGILRLGLTHILPDPTLSLILGDFSRAYPGIRFELHEASTKVLIEMLDENRIDVGVLSSASLHTELNLKLSQTITARTMVAYPRDSDWLSGDIDVIPISLLQNVPIAYPRGIESRLLQACRKAGFCPNVFAVSSTRNGAMLWAQVGRAVSVFISTAAEHFESDSLCCRPVNGYDLKVQRVFACMNDRKISPTAETFLNFVSQRLQEQSLTTSPA